MHVALFAREIMACPSSLTPSGFVVANNLILKLSDVDRGDGASAEGLAFSTRISIDMIH